MNHPWQQYYLNSDPISRSIFDSTLTNVQQFRMVTMEKWANENCIEQVSSKKTTTNYASVNIPQTPFALYVVLGNDGCSLVLTPIYKEIVAHDRPDLRFVQLTCFSVDTLNAGQVNIRQYHIGTVLCVTKLAPTSRALPANSGDVNVCHCYWTVAEFFSLPSMTKKNVLITPHRISNDGNYMCVSDTIFEEIQLSLQTALPHTRINHLFHATVFIPSFQPDQFLKSLKPENHRHVQILCRNMLPIGKIPPTAIHVVGAPRKVLEMFKTFQFGFAFHEAGFARNLLWTIVSYGDNGIRTIDNGKIDTNEYASNIDDWFIAEGKCFFQFRIHAHQCLEKWNRTVNAQIGIGFGDKRFFAEIIGASLITKTEYIVRARTDLQNSNLFEDNAIIFVKQFCPPKPRLMFHNCVIPGSNADKIIKAIYGGSEKIGDGLGTGDPFASYIRMINNPQLPMVIGSANSGCGKSTLIATAAVIMSQDDNNNIGLNIVTAITNSDVDVLIDKLMMVEPNLEHEIVRLGPKWSVSQNGSNDRSKFDFPTQLTNLVLEIIHEEKQYMLSYANDKFVERIRSIKDVFEISAESSIIQKLLNIFGKMELIRFYFDVRQPKIIVGTIDSIIKSFTTNCQHLTPLVSSIQIDECSMVPRATFLQILETFPFSRIALVGDRTRIPSFHRISFPSLLTFSALGSCFEDAINASTIPIVSFDTVSNNNTVEVLIEMINEKKRETKPIQYTFIDSNDDDQAANAMTLAKYHFQYFEPKNIAIICFCKSQLDQLYQWGRQNQVFVGFVDSTHGWKWEVCIILTGRSSFLFQTPQYYKDRRLINVALSRSCNINYIVGNDKKVRNAMYWQHLMEKCDNVNKSVLDVKQIEMFEH